MIQAQNSRSMIHQSTVCTNGHAAFKFHVHLVYMLHGHDHFSHSKCSSRCFPTTFKPKLSYQELESPAV